MVGGGFLPPFCSHSSEVVRATGLRQSSCTKGVGEGLGRQKSGA